MRTRHGVVYAKDVLKFMRDGQQSALVKPLARAMRASEVLSYGAAAVAVIRDGRAEEDQAATAVADVWTAMRCGGLRAVSSDVRWSAKESGAAAPPTPTPALPACQLL